MVTWFFTKSKNGKKLSPKERIRNKMSKKSRRGVEIVQKQRDIVKIQVDCAIIGD
jgi:hypothetical protein